MPTKWASGERATKDNLKKEVKILTMIKEQNNIRNIAIIAHVDHGKTTLVDAMLKQSGIFRENAKLADRMMDNTALEKERGITILSKNTAIHYKDFKINIIDTPGHADFSGEVERILKMADGVILIVDAYEGPMPQTKFVLGKALSSTLPVIVCINKIDRPDSRADEVVDEVLELLMDLGADDKQLDCPFIFASAKGGFASKTPDVFTYDLTVLFDTIINYIPAPKGNIEAPTAMLISAIDYNEYIGKIGIGKIKDGTIKVGNEYLLTNHHENEKSIKAKVTKLYEFDGLERIEVSEAGVGSIVAISGIHQIGIGDTLCDIQTPSSIPFQQISAPTISMYFRVNDSPLAGTEGKFLTSRHIKDRLFREIMSDVSLKIEETDSPDIFKVSGKGELHLSILVEKMRREGYEFAVSKPEVVYQYDKAGRKLEPMELVYIDVAQEFSGNVIQALSVRKGELQGMATLSDGSTRLEIRIPARGLIGYRSEFLTDTKGTGVMNTEFDDYELFKGEISYRKSGSLIAHEDGVAVAYGLFNAQDRGDLFITPGCKVYAGMIVGANPKAEDIELNVCKTKHLTNTRASGSDDALKLTPATILSLEEALDFIDYDELLEVTPQNLRLRKKILDKTLRKRANIQK